jgi:toxin ParE1/3/4
MWRIFTRTRRLEEFPHLGRVVPEYADESLRELIESSYRIVYQVYEDRLDVVAVVHGARKMPRDL